MPFLFRNDGVVCGEIPDALFESGEGRKRVLRNLRLTWRVEKEDFLKVLEATDASKEFFSDVQEVQMMGDVRLAGVSGRGYEGGADRAGGDGGGGVHEGESAEPSA